MTSKTMTVAMAVLAMVAVLATNLARGSATATTWTGGGAAGNWADPANWNNGAPVDSTWQAIFPNGTGALTFTSGTPSSLNKIQTGDALITLPSGLFLAAGSGYSPSAVIAVGTGGVNFGGAVSVYNGGWSITTAGAFTATSLSLDNIGGAQITSTGSGSYAISGEFQAVGVAGTIAGVTCTSGPTTFCAQSYPTGTITLGGTPTFAGGHRPNWEIRSAVSTPLQWNLNGQTLTGNVVQVYGIGGADRTAYLYNTVAGGVVDANAIVVGAGGTPGCYLDLHNATVNLRSGATAWDNRSTANTAFSVTDNVAVLVHANTNLDTGSRNLGTGGFGSNFAFGNLTLKSGVTATVTGDANLAPAENDALYVNGALSLENGSTLAMNARNAFLNGQLSVGNSPGTATIGGGDFAMTSSASFAVEINGLTAGTQYDQLVITGAGSDIALAGALNPSFGVFVANAGDIVFIVKNDGGNTTGTFTSLADDTMLGTYNGKRWRITYDASTASGLLDGGNDVAIYAIPEPATAAVLGLAGLLALRRRR